MAGLLKSVNKLLQPNLSGPLLSGCQHHLICRVPVSSRTLTTSGWSNCYAFNLQIITISIPSCVWSGTRLYIISIKTQTQKCFHGGQAYPCRAGLPLVRRFAASWDLQRSGVGLKLWGSEAEGNLRTLGDGEERGCEARADRNTAFLLIGYLGNPLGQGCFAGGSWAARSKERDGELLTPQGSAKQEPWGLPASPAGLEHRLLSPTAQNELLEYW